MKSSLFVRLLGAAAISALFLWSASLMQPAKAAVVIGHSLHGAAPFVKNRCPAHGGVRATPCVVVFSSSNPGPDMVSVSVPVTKKGTLQESDNCAGIATVAAQGSNMYLVSAGSNPGACSATFAFIGHHGKQIGFANLSVTNNL